MSFGKTMVKIAAELAPRPELQQRLDDHFVSPDSNKWGQFRQALRSKAFVQAIQQDPRADDKLKKYTTMLHKHMHGKGPRQQVGKYTVKWHEDIGRHSCSCLDWKYKKSHGGGDCKHIQQIAKTASMVRALSSLGGAALRTNKSKKENQRAQMVVNAYRSEMGKHASILRGAAACRLLGAK